MPLEKQVWDIMEAKYESITPETPLIEACTLLGLISKKEPGVPSLVVKRASGEYLGFLTIKDVLSYLINFYKESKREDREEEWLDRLRGLDPEEPLITVNDALIHVDIFVRPNQKMMEVLQIFEDLDVDFVPVADGERIVGVIRNTTILSEITPKPLRHS